MVFLCLGGLSKAVKSRLSNKLSCKIRKMRCNDAPIFDWNFRNDNTQIGAQGDPELGLHRVQGSAQKALHFQVLLDPLKEELDLPARFVKIGHRLGWDLQGIGNELIEDVRFLVPISDQPEGFGQFAQPNLSIFDHSRAFAATPLFTGRDDGVALEAGDEKYPVLSQILIPGVIGIAAVENQIRTSGKIKLSCMVDFMLFAIGQIDKCRQVAISIETDVKFGCPFGLLVLGPREQRERQFNQGSIQQVDPPVEFEGLAAPAWRESLRH